MMSEREFHCSPTLPGCAQSLHARRRRALRIARIAGSSAWPGHRREPRLTQIRKNIEERRD